MKSISKFFTGFFFQSLILISFFNLWVSCSKTDEVVVSAGSSELEISDYGNGDSKNREILNSSEKNDVDFVFDEIQQWYQTNKRIMVIFGYDFNIYPVMDNLKDYLELKFGLSEENGLIIPLVFPEDFRHNGKYFASDLYSLLNEHSNDLCGVIILGAPENTHIAFAKYQDLWGGSVPFPLIALFPQDDVLGLESACDFIIEKKSNEGIENDSDLTEEDSVFFEDAPYVLANVIDYILENDGGFSRDSNLLQHVNQALKKMSVHHYIDAETGIPSINHFVLN